MSKVTELKDKFVEIYTENIKRRVRKSCSIICFQKTATSLLHLLLQDTTEHTRVACANTAYTFMSA